MDLANRISEICLEKFNSLPKTGKPNVKFEWTILSAIVKVEKDVTVPKVEVVTIGTGTKCMGSSQLDAKGGVLNDSHAEVMARRGFLRYLMSEMKGCLGEGSSVFELGHESKKFTLKDGISFHFFTTHSPCGDASIYERADRSVEGEPCVKRAKVEMDSSEVGAALSDAEGMTGGKLLKCEGDDLMAQDLGMVRTKPGKGIRTLSLSCSDKMARWNMLGIQGCLLMSLLEQPIYLESIIICDGTELSTDAIERALWKRWDCQKSQELLKWPYKFNQLKVVSATDGKLFQFRKNRTVDDTNKFQPAPGGLVWCAGVSDRSLEVEIAGRRQGVTKKQLGTPAARLKISKIELFSAFVSLRQELTTRTEDESSCADECGEGRLLPRGQEGGADGDVRSLRYIDAKEYCRSYRELWQALRTEVFQVWSEKPSSLLEFTLDSGKCK